jgi:hypothetical protein
MRISVLILRRNQNQSDAVDWALVMMVCFHWHWIMYISCAISLELVLGIGIIYIYNYIYIFCAPTMGAAATVSLLGGATLRSGEGLLNSIGMVVFSKMSNSFVGL